MGKNDTETEIQQLRSEVAGLGTILTELKELMIEVRSAVQTDHKKLEKLEVTAKHDHRVLQSLENTKRVMETTGRIQVGRTPVGL